MIMMLGTFCVWGHFAALTLFSDQCRTKTLFLTDWGGWVIHLSFELFSEKNVWCQLQRAMLDETFYDIFTEFVYVLRQLVRVYIRLSMP